MNRVRTVFLLAVAFALLLFFQQRLDAASSADSFFYADSLWQVLAWSAAFGVAAAFFKAGSTGRFASYDDRRLRALVADEPLADRQSLQQQLEVMGFEVAVECNGSRAADRALNAPFDVILVAENLPVLDGRSVRTVLRQAGVSVPLVTLQNGVADSSNEQDHYLQKPIEFEQLRDCLMAALPIYSRERMLDVASSGVESEEGFSEVLELSAAFESQDYRRLSEVISKLRDCDMIGSEAFRESIGRLESVLDYDEATDAELEQLRSTIEELADLRESTTRESSLASQSKQRRRTAK